VYGNRRYVHRRHLRGLRRIRAGVLRWKYLLRKWDSL
jgi:hypothetical protein